MRFNRPAIVLKQPLLVALVVGFTVAVLLAGLWPDGEPIEPQPFSWWVLLVWVPVLALLALGAAMLCHAEEIVVDGASRRVTQTHRLLHRDVKVNVLSFSDFTGVAVKLQIDKEEQGSSMPTGASTLTNRRTVHKRRYELSLSRPDHVLKTAERTLTAPRHALRIPLPDESDAQGVEATARALAALGGWPATRQDYTLLNAAGAAPTVKVIIGNDEPLA